MVSIDPNQTVTELARSVPGAFRVFERHGIDVGCGGKRPLAEACAIAHTPLDSVLQALSDASTGPQPNEPPTGLAKLIAHIIDTHHVFEAAELARLKPIAEKVLRVHGERHPELAEVNRLLSALSADLLSHMQKEEVVVFPAMRALENGEAPRVRSVTLDQPLGEMLTEDARVRELLRELERVTDRYTPPTHACGSYRALYQRLAELQADLQRHIYLENELLFPRARALEAVRS